MTQKTNKLAIVVGHESKAQGALVGKPLNTTEYQFNKMIADVMFRYAIELNLEPKVFFRDGVGISGVGRLVNDWQASATIELHVNSATPQAFGSETLFDMDPSDSKELAWLCQKSMVSVFKRKGKGDRGAKLLKPEDRGHYQLSLYKMPACITEPAFGSNSGDCQLLWSNASGYARGLVVAVKDFLGGKHA